MERGIAAIFIVLHHISQRITVIKALIVMRYIGFISVAVFFFISGYGLMSGFIYKKDYLKGFLRKRMLKILIPYWMVNMIAIAIDLWKGGKHEIYQYAASFLGFDYFTGTWFVTAILIMYLLFYVCFRFADKLDFSLHRKHTKPVIMLAGIIIYCAVCWRMDLSSSYTASIAAFLLGVMWPCHGHRVVIWLRKGFISKLILVSGMFGILFAGRLLLVLKGFDGWLLQTVLRNLVSISFIFLIITITQKIQLKGRVLNWFGDISYELYMVHYIMRGWLDTFNLSDKIYILALGVAAVGVSWMLRMADRKAIKLISV